MFTGKLSTRLNLAVTRLYIYIYILYNIYNIYNIYIYIYILKFCLQETLSMCLEPAVTLYTYFATLELAVTHVEGLGFQV